MNNSKLQIQEYKRLKCIKLQLQHQEELDNTEKQISELGITTNNILKITKNVTKNTMAINSEITKVTHAINDLNHIQTESGANLCETVDCIKEIFSTEYEDSKSLEDKIKFLKDGLFASLEVSHQLKEKHEKYNYFISNVQKIKGKEKDYQKDLTLGPAEDKTISFNSTNLATSSPIKKK